MEIRVVEEKGRAQIEVTILSGPDDPRVSGIVRQLQMVDGKMDTFPAPSTGASFFSRMLHGFRRMAV